MDSRLPSYATYETWNDSIDASIQDYINSGKKEGVSLWSGYDNYGQRHYSTASKAALDRIISNYNTGTPSETQYTRSDGTQYVLQSNKDKDGKVTYSTMQKGLYDLNNTNAENTKTVENIWKDNEKNTKAAYAGLDAKAQAMYDTANNITNGNYDATANDIYLQYRQNQKKLNEQMSKMGMTGGASETAQIGQLNTYSKNYAGNEGARNAALQSNLQDYNTNIYNNAKALADALVQVYGNKANALTSNAESNAASQRDYQAERRGVSDDAYAAARNQKYSLEQIKAQAEANADSELKVYKAKQKYDAKVIKNNKKSVDKSNSTKQAEAKAAKKKGQTVFEWYEVNSYGNYVYHWTTNGSKARARGSAAGTTVYRNGSVLSESDLASIQVTKRSK